MAATVAPAPSSADGSAASEAAHLHKHWRWLSRFATCVSLLALPELVLYLVTFGQRSLLVAVLLALVLYAAFRGALDLGLRRLLPRPSLFGVDDAGMKQADIVHRRRAHFWRGKYRLAVWLLLLLTLVWGYHRARGGHEAWLGSGLHALSAGGHALTSRTLWMQVLFGVLLLFINMALFIVPMVAMGISQVKSFEPGDASWGVKLDDVRGQTEAKDEVKKIVTLWQSGERFKSAGGRRERGALFVGQPGSREIRSPFNN